MDIWSLIQHLEDISPDIVMIDGVLFLDRNRVGCDKIREQSDAFSSLSEASRWMNMVPIDDFLNDVIGDWDIDDQSIPKLAHFYEISWQRAVKYSGFESKIGIEILKDYNAGDLIFRMTQ